MKAKFQSRIEAGLQRVFSQAASQGQGYSSIAQQQWMMLADAISDIAMDVVIELTTNAEVVAGQSVVGVGGGIPGPVTGTTVSPGKII
jgi:hypothetical protein